LHCESTNNYDQISKSNYTLQSAISHCWSGCFIFFRLLWAGLLIRTVGDWYWETKRECVCSNSIRTSQMIGTLCLLRWFVCLRLVTSGLLPCLTGRSGIGNVLARTSTCFCTLIRVTVRNFRAFGGDCTVRQVLPPDALYWLRFTCNLSVVVAHQALTIRGHRYESLHNQ
jgi:hypothetical protein